MRQATLWGRHAHGGQAHAPVRWSALLGLIAVASCNEFEQSPPRIDVATPPAHGSLTLRRDADQPFALKFFSVVNDSQVIAYDRAGGQVWLLSHGAQPRATPMTGVTLPRAHHIVAASGEAQRVGLLDAHGVLHIIDMATARETDSLKIAARGSAHVVGLHALPGGAWAILEARSTGKADETARDTLVLSRLDATGKLETIWQREKQGAVARNQLFTDFVSMTGHADTILIASTAPARVTQIIATVSGAPTMKETLLRAAPQRAIPSAEQADVRQALRQAKFPEGAVDVPTMYPAVARLWTTPSGYISMAGDKGERFVLDQYCGGQFSRTVLRAPDVTDVAWFQDLVIVRRQAKKDSKEARLDFLSRFSGNVTGVVVV